MKKYLALARVSSEEQQREGFSLDIQEDALREWVAKDGGEIVKMYRVAETAHKSDKRTVFREMLAHARELSDTLDGLLFYKVDRAARNMKDWIELLELRDRLNIKIICITEPFDESPAGKLNGNMIAAISQFYSDQLSIRTQEGVARRVKSGFFPGHAPYGYENYRENGRGLIRINEERAANVRRIFELYAYHRHTLESITHQMKNEGRVYRNSMPNFQCSMVHRILTDRSYIGDIKHRGQWHEGTHAPIVDRSTFDRVQTLLGVKTYSNHESVYGSALVTCGHCGRPLVCEVKTKQTKSGEREYRYYRCSRYTSKDHPRHRVNESELDRQMMAVFASLKAKDEKVVRWMQSVIRAKTQGEIKINTKHFQDIQRQMAQIEKDRNSLLTLRMHGEIEADTFAQKDTELRDMRKRLQLQLEGQDRQKSEIGELALKVLELSQTIKDKWLTSDVDEKRRILEIVCLNLTLNGVSLDISMRKPFDVLAEGLSLNVGSGGGI